MQTPIRVGLVGTGRIGRIHASVIANTPGLRLTSVTDVNSESATEVASAFNVEAMPTVDKLLGSANVDAVAICTSTDGHVDVIVAAAAAGKAIFCEKPISIDLSQVDRAIAAVNLAKVPFLVGFNRRFDPHNRAVRSAVHRGDIGELHILRITSRDPIAPPVSYVKVSGGIFVDMMIHDFDMAHYISGSKIVEIFAKGAVRIDPAIGEVGDIDTAVVVLTHEDGTITTIDNSRQAVYGYDQRIEAFGSKGMVTSQNVLENNAILALADGSHSARVQDFFPERYAEAYRNEWLEFAKYLIDGGPSPVSIEDGRHPIVAGLAAGLSLREGRPVRLSEISIPASQVR